MIPSIVRRNLLATQINRGQGFKNYFHSSAAVANEFENSLRENYEKSSVKNLLDNSSAFVETSPEQIEDKWATLPYVDGTIMSRDERNDLGIERQKIDPRDTSIILFPGQGAQFVGMAKSLVNIPVAKDVFDYASEILNYDLLKLCNDGPKSQLNDISHSHAAIVTTSLANLEVLREERPDAVLNCVGTAGFSVGEITALVFAGALQFDEALQLVQVRAEAIKAASEMHKGGMASIIYGPDSQVIAACKAAKEYCFKNGIKKPECYISNFMHPRYKVLSGSELALQYIKENLKRFRIRSIRSIKKVPASHCSLMEPTIEPLKEALNHIQISDPLIRVYSNVTGKPFVNAKHILKLMPQHLIKSVRWEQTMHNIYARRQGEYFPRTIVCGPNVAIRSILEEVNSKAFRQSIHIGDIKPEIKKKITV